MSSQEVKLYKIIRLNDIPWWRSRFKLKFFVRNNFIRWFDILNILEIIHKLESTSVIATGIILLLNLPKPIRIHAPDYLTFNKKIMFKIWLFFTDLFFCDNCYNNSYFSYWLVVRRILPYLWVIGKLLFKCTTCTYNN